MLTTLPHRANRRMLVPGRGTRLEVRGWQLVLLIAALMVAAPALAQPQGRDNPRHVAIKGLVVAVQRDGLYHGKAVDIIGVPAPETTDPRGNSFRSVRTRAPFKLVPRVGEQMRIAFDEAVRLVRLRKPRFVSPIDVSFGEKYSRKDGGSAGAAFALVLLASMGDFEINTKAAITGDITVDSKVRGVGAVAEKVHGAALDKCTLVAIPAEDAVAMDDAVLLDGVSVLWETQIFSVATLDAAIAVMRKDPPPQVTRAMVLFDELKASHGTRPASSLKDVDVREKLTSILSLAPNHVSAKALQRIAEGNAPARLSPMTTISRSIAAAGPMRDGLAEGRVNKMNGSRENLKDALSRLERIRQIGDVDAVAVIPLIKAYVETYAAWAEARGTRGEVQPLRARIVAVRAGIEKMMSDSAFIDKVLHP